MSVDDKKKINSIATSAEVNQNAFSYIVVGNSTVAADSKTDTLTLAAGSNVTLTPATNTDTITIAATNSTYTNATTATAGLMSSSDKQKLNSIASSANIGVTGSGTNNYIAKWNGTTALTNGPAFGSATNTFLRNDGSWAIPPSQEGGDINQNAFSYVTIGSSTIAADSETDTLTIAAGNNITLTPDTSNDKITITATNSTYTNVTTAAAGLMTAADKIKLNSIASSAQVNPIFTAFTGKPIGNTTVDFGGTFTISQISQSTSGQVSGTDRTIIIPSAVATTAAAGLMSSSDKQKLNSIASSATDNKGTVGGTGTNGYLAKWNGSTSITSGPQLGSATNTYLRNDGSWATPASGTTNSNIIDGSGSSALHQIGTSASGNYASALGYHTTASGYYSHAQGYNSMTSASSTASHAQGYLTTASGNYSHSENRETKAAGNSSHVEGYQSIANGQISHAEGWETVSAANSTATHAEGRGTSAIGNYSHAEGYNTKTSANQSHAEGYGTIVAANAGAGHAEGYQTTAIGEYSHAGGRGTIANVNGMTAIGTFNSTGDGYLFTVGNGTGTADRSNAFTVTTAGSADIASSLLVHGSITGDNNIYIGTSTKETSTYVQALTSNSNIQLLASSNGKRGLYDPLLTHWMAYYDPDTSTNYFTGLASSATRDGEGNNIASTYGIKSITFSSGDILCPAIITGSSKNIILLMPTARRPFINNPVLNSLTISVRRPSGGTIYARSGSSGGTYTSITSEAVIWENNKTKRTNQVSSISISNYSTFGIKITIGFTYGLASASGSTATIANNTPLGVYLSACDITNSE